jgi:hypothetical protein
MEALEAEVRRLNAEVADAAEKNRNLISASST